MFVQKLKAIWLAPTYRLAEDLCQQYERRSPKRLAILRRVWKTHWLSIPFYNWVLEKFP